jgi:hypothetical protein
VTPLRRVATVVFLCLATRSTAAPAPEDFPLYRDGFIDYRAGRYVAATQAWRNAADAALARRRDNAALERAAFAQVLATIAAERAESAVAYQTWADAVRYSLEAGKPWETTRQELARIARRTSDGLAAAAGADGRPAVADFDQMILDIDRDVAWARYGGPGSGLKAEGSGALPTINVAHDYFARPPVAARDSAEQIASQSPYRDAEPTPAPPSAVFAPGAATPASAASPEEPPASGTPSPPPAPVLPSGSLARSGDESPDSAAPPAFASRTMRPDRSPPSGAPTSAPVRSSATAVNPADAGGLPAVQSSVTGTRVAPASAPAMRRPLSQSDLSAVYDDLDRRAAESAFAYVTANRQAQTGLVNGKDGYPVTTVADFAATIAAIVAAEQLNLISRPALLDLLLPLYATLADLPLVDQSLFNREYDARTGRMLDLHGAASTAGGGWSAWDHARLFAWLHIAAGMYPELAEPALTVRNRLRLTRLAEGGVATGATLDGGTLATYTEGTLGYRQYIGAAYSLAGLNLAGGFDYAGTSVTAVDGVRVLVDDAPNANLATDPFLFGIIEFGGLDGCFELAALAMFDAQRARGLRVGASVALGDELLDREPWYVSNTVIGDGQPWKVATLGGADRPLLRSFSAKSAFGLWAVRPDDGGRTLRKRAQSLAGPHGFSAGFYESGAVNTAITLATNSAILESLWFVRRGGKSLLHIDNPAATGCPLSPGTAEANAMTRQKGTP